MTDKDLEQGYRAASTEQPSAAADAAILALARAAAAETILEKAAEKAAANAAETAVAAAGDTRGALRPAGKVTMLRRWRAPLGLAASLVLAVGIVSRVQVEEEAGTAPGSVPVAAPAPAGPSVTAAPTASAPATPTPTNDTSPASEAVLAKREFAPTTLSPAPVPAPAPAPARAATPSTTAPAELTLKPEVPEKRKALADNVVTADTGVRKEVAPTARDAVENKLNQPLAASPAASSVAAAAASSPAPSAAFPEMSAAAPAMIPSAPPQSAPLTRNATATVSTEVQRDDAPRARVAPARAAAAPPAGIPLQESIEATLTPEQWLRRIADARRAGRDDEADASLKRFIAKHPSLPVPPEARRAEER